MQYAQVFKELLSRKVQVQDLRAIMKVLHRKKNYILPMFQCSKRLNLLNNLFVINVTSLGIFGCYFVRDKLREKLNEDPSSKDKLMIIAPFAYLLQIFPFFVFIRMNRRLVKKLQFDVINQKMVLTTFVNKVIKVHPTKITVLKNNNRAIESIIVETDQEITYLTQGIG